LIIQTVINKTLRPIKIALPRGKTLYLGPSGRGQVHDDTLERPAFKKMVEAGDVEVLDQDESSSVSSDGDSARVRHSSHGLAGNRNTARKGDR
jgi:hypothetical protein